MSASSNDALALDRARGLRARRWTDERGEGGDAKGDPNENIVSRSLACEALRARHLANACRSARSQRGCMCCRRQLKEIFDDLGIDYKGASKDELKALAYKEDAVGRWEEKYPEKKRKPPVGGGGFPGMEGMGGGDPKMEELLRQMKGDFSAEKDPVRKRILTKLAAKGMSFGGGSSMSTEQLVQMEKMLENLGDLKGNGAAPGGAADAARETSEDDDVPDDDKMEL